MTYSRNRRMKVMKAIKKACKQSEKGKPISKSTRKILVESGHQLIGITYEAGGEKEKEDETN